MFGSYEFHKDDFVFSVHQLSANSQFSWICKFDEEYIFFENIKEVDLGMFSKFDEEYVFFLKH